MSSGLVLLHQQEIARLNTEIRKLQEECAHPNLVRTPRSDTGNWCKSDDRYWYDCVCPDCDKFWMEDQ